LRQNRTPVSRGTVKYSLVIFDMDGTLTEETINFDAIREEIGLPSASGILEQLAQLPPEESRRGHAILHRHEHEAATTCRLLDGAAELLNSLRPRQIKTALLTRNSSHCAAN